MKLADSAALLGFAALARSMAVLPLVREEDCVCKTDRFFDVQVVVHETPAGYHVPIETLVEQPTVLELVPGCTLTVSDVPTSICTTVIPTAVIRSTKTVSRITFTACPSDQTATQSGADPGHETVAVCLSDPEQPPATYEGPAPETTTQAPRCTTACAPTPIPTVTITQTEADATEAAVVAGPDAAAATAAALAPTRGPGVQIPPLPPTPADACRDIPPGCAERAGLTVHYYENDMWSHAYGRNFERGGDPDYYLPLTPLDRGQTRSLSVPYFYGYEGMPGGYLREVDMDYYPGLTNRFAGIEYNANNFTLVFTGYYRPLITGTHTFCANADNVHTFYLGADSAFPCGAPANRHTPPGAAPLVRSHISRGPRRACADRELIAGLYYPLRAVYGNRGLPSSLAFTVRAPGREASFDVGEAGYPAECGRL